MQNDSFNKFIGTQIRQFRINKGLSLQDVAERIGVTKKTVGNYETNKTNIKLETLKHLCMIYDVDFDSLMNIAKEYI